MSHFCQSCGTATVKQVPEHDHLPRNVCLNCGFIHYENPKMVCGVIATYQERVLLCKRAIEPSYGLWTLPAGFLEIGETMQAGAIRECWEEAEAKVKIEQLYCMYNIPFVGHIYALFKGELIDGQFGVGSESLESLLFSEEQIPWQQLAFPSIKRTLEHYFHDRKTQHFPLHLEDFSPEDNAKFYQSLTLID